MGCPILCEISFLRTSPASICFSLNRCGPKHMGKTPPIWYQQNSLLLGQASLPLIFFFTGSYVTLWIIPHSEVNVPAADFRIHENLLARTEILDGVPIR